MVGHVVQGFDQLLDQFPVQGIAFAVVIKGDGADGVVEFRGDESHYFSSPIWLKLLQDAVPKTVCHFLP